MGTAKTEYNLVWIVCIYIHVYHILLDMCYRYENKAVCAGIPRGGLMTGVEVLPPRLSSHLAGCQHPVEDDTPGSCMSSLPVYLTPYLES